MNPKVSVIIPIYNSSKYIIRCCHSLFSQTLDSIQYIFVDDGSEDGSLALVKDVLQGYPHRVNQATFLVHEVNRGVGNARYNGLQLATGDYVIHCDSDDWVEPNAYELLYKKAITTEADIVSCGYSIDAEDGSQMKLVPAYQSDSKYLTFDIGPQTGSLVLKLIRRELLSQNSLQVPIDIEWGEDFCLSLESLLLSRNTQCINEILYHYVQHEDSITHSITSSTCLSLIKCGKVIESFLNEHHLSNHYSFQLNWLKFQLKQYLLIFPQTRDLKLWKSYYPECHKDILRYNTTFYLKISAWLIVHHLQLIAVLVLKMRDLLSYFKRK